MRRLGLLLTIAVLGLCAVLAVLWLRRDTAVPMIPLVPGVPTEGPRATEPVAAPSDLVAPDTADLVVAPERIEPPPAIDEQVAILFVEVLRPTNAAAPGPESGTAPLRTTDPSRPGTGTAVGEPIPDLEVEVAIEGREPAERRSALTDARGVARFEFPGGDGLSATVRCPVATSTQVRLQAAAPVHLTLAFCLRGTVRGTVVDAAGRGIGGADLLLLPPPTSEHGAPRVRRVGRARNDGSFELALSVGGALGATHPDYAPSAMWPVPVQTDPMRAPIATVLQLSLLTAPCRLQGQVLDHQGQPVADAQLEFRAAAAAPAGAALSAPTRHSRSAADGTFLVEQLRPGRIDYAARADGRGFQRGTLELAPGAGQALEIRLSPPCEVHGRVEDALGKPIANARVWSGTRGDLDSLTVRSGADGTFQLTGLPPGPVVLSARETTARSGDPLLRRASTRLELVPGQVAQWIARLAPADDEGHLRGQLVDTEGARLPTWRILVRSRGGTTETKTDSGGFFHLAVPDAGPLDVFVHAPDAQPRAFAHSVLRGVVAAAGPMRLVVDRRPPTGSLAGRVQAQDQAPLAATLICWHHQRQEQATFRSEADGSFRIDSVPPGTLDVYVEHPGYARLLQADVVVVADQTLDLATLRLDQSAVLFGQVLGPTGEPPADLQVTLRTADQPVLGEYSAGTYRFAAAPPGRHVLQVQGTAVAAANFVVELKGGVELQRDMRLDAGVPRRINVRAPAAAGTTVFLALRVPGAAHTWHGSTALKAPCNPTQGDPARAEGEFVACMAPGTYEAIVWTGDAWEAHANVPFVAGDDSVVTIDLLPR